MVEILRRGQLPQASLFTGPEGVGKKTLALSLAAMANCKGDTEDELCGTCSSCVKESAGHHPDIWLFQPHKNVIHIGKDSRDPNTMRELNREVQFRPFEGRLRFFIIDQAETMTEKAANCILKTLEEPPETSRIILITSFPHRLLPTIRSRCQAFPFHPLGREEVLRYLEDHLTEDHPEMRASLAEGSIAVALRLDLEETLGQRDRMLELLTSWCGQESFEALYKQCEQLPLRSELKTREGVRRYLNLLQRIGEDLYFLQVDTPQRVVNQDRLDDLQKLSEGIELNWVRDFLYHVDRARWDIDHYVNPLMCFETLWLMSSRETSNVGNRHRQV
ncbi:MAG: DNA polymerase III subunit delta' [Acidobacteria bacterium]|nr:MAG: DNA polymerase III subunit delta' [Acidobacteriota bacterium]